MKNLFFFPKLFPGEYEENYMKTMFSLDYSALDVGSKQLIVIRHPLFFFNYKDT